MSRTAVLAAMFAVPLCCPPMSLLACVTGGVALWQMRRDARLRGAWLAWTAIVVGALCAGVMSFILWTNGLGLIVRGPTAPIRAVIDASPEAMRADWSGPAAESPPEALRNFADAMQSRWGAFVSADGSATRTTPLKPVPGRSIATVPVVLRFERASVEADFGIELFDERTGSTVMKWRSLRIPLPDGGELVFPSGEPPPPPLEAPPPRSEPSARPAPALR
jgi:hypothetical protein